MTTTTHTGSPQRGPENYTTSAGLRALLARLHAAGPGAWARDPVAGELMQYAAQKYAALARKHSLDPWETASAAFDVMRTRSAREAIDPWGVVTHAVRITCIAEERAQGLLCSTHQARRPHISAFHDAERISDRETPLSEYHPAFQVTDPEPETDPAGGSADNGDGDGPADVWNPTDAILTQGHYMCGLVDQVKTAIAAKTITGDVVSLALAAYNARLREMNRGH